MKIDFLAKLLIILAITGFLGGCSSKPRDVKSPCVGIEGSPCERRPANADVG